MKIESLDPKMRLLLSCIPQRNEAVEWVEEDGLVVLIYPKNFTRFERFLHKRIGGPENIRRPLDDKGTFIWKMCDGEHNVHEICKDSYAEFKEDIEPVVRRVWGFLEKLLQLNLLSIDVPKDENEEVKGEEEDKESGEEGSEKDHERDSEEMEDGEGTEVEEDHEEKDSEVEKEQ